MYLTRHQTDHGPRWALDDSFLPPGFSLALALEMPKRAMIEALSFMPTSEPARGALLPPLEPFHEVWASGVTYVRSRQARQSESQVGNVYETVYDAARPELFFKAIGRRVVGHAMPIRIRRDSHWNVPEPEMVLVVNHAEEIVGICAGNDVSSRDIEGENPLYLPQAKVYRGSCSLGPGLLITDADEVRDIPIKLEILRERQLLFQGETRTSKMKRSLEELVTYLVRELDFPQGVFLMTGTGVVPADDFTLELGDLVRISVASLTLENVVHGE
jgi:2-dehydro-3-deoxy-D-arabinonate dehydratase